MLCPLMEETHYYPFGLTMAGISSKALKNSYLENKKKYQQYEFTGDFDINVYESFYRTQDPQLGRFLQLDPKPTDYESLYVSMGNNPINNFDVLGDIFEGVDEKSAQRALELIKNTFTKVKGSEALQALFSLSSDDGVTFSKIDEKDFNTATKGLSKSARALAKGYLKLINSDKRNFVSVVKSDDGEKVDLSKVQGMAAPLKAFDKFDMTNEGGKSRHSFIDNQSLTMVDLNNKVSIAGVSKKHGPYVPSAEFIMAHEAIGHILSGFENNRLMSWDTRSKVGDVDAIRVNNLYLRTVGSNLTDNGASHNDVNGVKKAMDASSDVKSTPQYLNE